MAGPYNISDILPVIPASKLKSTTSADKQLVKDVVLNSQNTTGAGLTYTETSPCVLQFMQLTNLTPNDTKYRLTIDGVIYAQEVTAPVNATSRTIIDADGSARLGKIPITCPNGFSLFVQSATDGVISVTYTIVELA